MTSKKQVKNKRREARKSRAEKQINRALNENFSYDKEFKEPTKANIKRFSKALEVIVKSK